MALHDDRPKPVIYDAKGKPIPKPTIGFVRPSERPTKQTQMTEQDLRERAEAIDRQCDAQLFDGMPQILIRMVEEQRQEAHAALAREAINAGLAAPSATDRWFQEQVARRKAMNISGDPITRIW